VVDCCCICKISGKSIDNLFLHCEVERDLWSAIFTLFAVQWVMPSRVRPIVILLERLGG
jgi:hypothetical protein